LACYGKGIASQVHLEHDATIPAKLAKEEVSVRVQAAALNPEGLKVMSVLPDFILKRPYAPEQDLAGVIVDANANGTEFQNGDEFVHSLG